MMEWTDIVIAFFTAVLAYFAYLSHKVYVLMSRPMVFARLRDGKERMGIIVENAGNGVAWNGKVTVTALSSTSKSKYKFTRLYGRSANEYPTGVQPKIIFDTTDERLKISIDYEDEERGGKKYHWENEFNLPKEGLTASEGTE